MRSTARAFADTIRPSAPRPSTEPAAAAAPPAPAAAGAGQAVNAVLAGNIFKVHVTPGATVREGDPLLIVEAMKMETVVPAPRSGTVTEVFVAEGDKTFLMFAPQFSHSVTTKGRTCRECHATEAVARATMSEGGASVSPASKSYAVSPARL